MQVTFSNVSFCRAGGGGGWGYGSSITRRHGHNNNRSSVTHRATSWADVRTKRGTRTAPNKRVQK